jgi:hypothetical protein
LSYFAQKRHERLLKIINFVEKAKNIHREDLRDEIMGSFGVTEAKANEYIDALINIGVLKFIAVAGKHFKLVIKDGRKLETMIEEPSQGKKKAWFK